MVKSVLLLAAGVVTAIALSILSGLGQAVGERVVGGFLPPGSTLRTKKRELVFLAGVFLLCAGIGTFAAILGQDLANTRLARGSTATASAEPTTAPSHTSTPADIVVIEPEPTAPVTALPPTPVPAATATIASQPTEAGTPVLQTPTPPEATTDGDEQTAATAALPLSNPFTVEDADAVVLGPDCNYQVEDEDLEVFFLDGTKSNFHGTANDDGSITWNLAELPRGNIVGDAVVARIDGYVLGDRGVTFLIALDTSIEARYLTLSDGAFEIVAPEDAKGLLRLRQRYLECKGNFQEVVPYP